MAMFFSDGVLCTVGAKEQLSSNEKSKRRRFMQNLQFVIILLEFLLFYVNNVNVINERSKKECSFLKEESGE